jgi:serine/threonine protein kinase
MLAGKGTYSKVIINKDDPTTVTKLTDSTDYDNIIREVAFIKYMNHPNIVQPSYIEFTTKGVCIIRMPRYEMNLHDYMKSREYTSTDILRISIELLSALTYMHKSNIIHGDIKPKNILVNKNNIAICDFNISCLASDGPLSSIMQTCTYRAPEINLARTRSKYDQGIDVWSVGCIMFELLTKEPLLQYTGKNDDDDSTISVMKRFGYDATDKRHDRYRKLIGLTAADVKHKLASSFANCTWGLPALNDFINIICLCLTPNRHKRAQSCQILYLLLGIYKSVVKDNSIIDQLMYGIEVTSHLSPKKALKCKQINQLAIYSQLPTDIIHMFNKTSINFANKLYLKLAHKPFFDQRVLYSILFITMAMCGEPHTDILDTLEIKYTKRQLYNTAVVIFNELNFRLI